jgi:hypothetical protein
MTLGDKYPKQNDARRIAESVAANMALDGIQVDVDKLEKWIKFSREKRPKTRKNAV